MSQNQDRRTRAWTVAGLLVAVAAGGAAIAAGD
ncbi:MAG: hypothetical protein JWP49_1396, partial [Phenylobacterium sp.]|nr:hypothetical protein [Phenylobacterium sp.]